MSTSKTSLNQAVSFLYLGAQLLLVIIQEEKPVTTNVQQTNKKFTTGCESVKERENHHKWKILMTIQVCKHYTYCSMCEQWFNLCLYH